jgi:hypothetical protein
LLFKRDSIDRPEVRSEWGAGGTYKSPRELAIDFGHGFNSCTRMRSHSMRFWDAQNGREGGQNTGTAVLPSLRIGNTSTSKTSKFRA